MDTLAFDDVEFRPFLDIYRTQLWTLESGYARVVQRVCSIGFGGFEVVRLI